MKRPVGASAAGNFTGLLLLVSGMIMFGVLMSFSMVPSIYESSNGPGVNSILTKHDIRPMKEKILEWLPKHHDNLVDHLDEADDAKPDWNQKFWTPIDLDVSNDPMVTLCKLNFKEYSENPHMYSMFGDFVNLSNCMGSNRRRERLSVLMKEIRESDNSTTARVVKPTGFVFHESRVGSTLVANLLGSDPWSMIFSESAPAANALLHCSGCSKQQNIAIFRDVVTLMGRSPFHKRLFFKFQSITTTRMEIALEVRSLFCFLSGYAGSFSKGIKCLI